MDLAGKRVLVTGGSRGIGAAVAIDLASHGARVVVNGRHDDDQSRQTVRAASDGPGEACFIQADVGSEDAAQRLVAQAADRLGGLDILVHAAGGPAGGSIDDVPTDAWLSAFDVHVHAAFYLVRAALPHLRANEEGSVVLVSSVAGIRGIPNAIAYGVVKGAVLQMTRMLARDLADDDIRVNCVAPGIIRTRFHDAMTEQQKQHNLASRIPLHREGTPAQVAESIRLLATNRFITGECLVVDGGMTMQISR